jgi:hypothetical protein
MPMSEIFFTHLRVYRGNSQKSVGPWIISFFHFYFIIWPDIFSNAFCGDSYIQLTLVKI